MNKQKKIFCSILLLVPILFLTTVTFDTIQLSYCENLHNTYIQLKDEHSRRFLFTIIESCWPDQS